ncbi:hypothetical protein PTTG_08263 [Puccinia triticina 1-1 BBBD Race 1]|uniref:Uncharacterized protein n=1 Tax=Puccinia triticina (isolate 1-1 / race 1 (BBBD)) TaxID=630390 RepID=A0A0C4F565_PUCT1|nr:hypothetical protein PTTG_08263 [Puccinia triticina 1-1 BBBD Race 1]WAR55768.1 hypothetical protein PtB15_6B511 [Puccinia triticina]
MDPNLTPPESDSADDQPGQSTGGFRPVEEPAHPSPLMQPEADAEHVEENSDQENPPPPHAEHGAAEQDFVHPNQVPPELARQRAAHDARRRAWEQAIEPLSPDYQAVYRSIAEGSQRVLEELGDDPNRRVMSVEEVEAFCENWKT